MDKKLQEYFIGKEKLTEEEAFILVREHFGKPEQIRELLEEVHSVETHVSFIRKLGAIYIATSVVFLFSDYIEQFIQSLFFGFLNFQFIRDEIIFSSYITIYLPLIFSISILLFVVYRWRIKMENGERMWFENLNPYLFIFTALAMFFFILPANAEIYFPIGKHALNPLSALSVKMGAISPLNPIFSHFMHILRNEKILSDALICMTWLWWFDRSAKRILSISLGFISWFIIIVLLPYLQFLYMLLLFNYAPHPLRMPFHTPPWIGLMGIVCYSLFMVIHEKLNKHRKLPQLFSE